MKVSSKDRDWSRAYAAQGLSDLRARDLLVSCEICHPLHYLQMAAEKICKAHLCISAGHGVANKKTHHVIKKNLPILVRVYSSKLEGRPAIMSHSLETVRKFADEIEVLAPAVIRGGARQDNCEYPWETLQGEVRVPCQWNFPDIPSEERILTPIVKLLRTVAVQLTL